MWEVYGYFICIVGEVEVEYLLRAKAEKELLLRKEKSDE